MIRRFIVFVVLGFALSGCAPTSWTSLQPAPRSGSGRLPRVARLILMSGDTLAAYDAVVQGDTVVWEAEPSGAPIQNAPMEARKRFAVALNRIKTIQAPEAAGEEAGGGGGLVLAIVGVSLLIASLVALQSWKL